jgi:hypothetical protein
MAWHRMEQSEATLRQNFPRFPTICDVRTVNELGTQMEALEQNEPDTDGHAGGFDFEEAAKLCGLSKLQKDFARAILRGANRT